MAIFRTTVSITAVLAAIQAPGLAAQSASSASARNLVLVSVTSDMKGVFSFERGKAYSVTPERQTVIRLPPGRYRGRAATEDGKTYWERVFIVRNPGPLTIRIELAEASSRRATDEKILEGLRAQRMLRSAAVQAAGAGIDTSRSRATGGGGPDQAAIAMQWVNATIRAISRLEQQADSYTRAAGQLKADAGDVSARASALSANPTVGALAGVIGMIGADSLEKDAWRNRMRARGALRRVNRLTGALGEASDNGFNYLAEPASTAVFETKRKGTPGHLTVSDDHIGYVENVAIEGHGAPVTRAFSVSCSEVRSVRTNGTEVNIKVNRQEVKVSPINITAEDLLAEIFIACPARTF